MFRARYIIPAALVILLVLAVIGNGKEAEESPPQPTQLAPAPAQQPIQVQTQEDGEDQETSTIPPPKVPGAVPVEQRLAQQVRSFAQDLYLIKPGDTTSTRKRRMRQHVPERFIDDLELEMRQSTNLTQRGEPITDEIRAAVLNDNRHFLEIALPVTLVLTDPSGKEAHRESTALVSRWKLHGKRWKFSGIGKLR